MIKSGSISNLNPSPVHLLHAPYGVLKEKFLGSNGSIEISQFRHAYSSE